jgi:cell division septation protein DedD
VHRDSRFARDTIFAGLVMAALGGCVAIPVGITAASAAFDGMSYVSTGKAPHDHALSAVTGEDCAVWRVVKEKPVCVEPRGTGAREVVYAPGNGALAFAPPAMTPIGVSPAPTPEKAPEAAIATESLPPPAPAPQVAAIAPAAPLPTQPVAAVQPIRASNPPRATVPADSRTASLAPAPAPALAPVASTGRKVLVVLGSFQDAERAAAASSTAKGTRVMAVTVDGRKMYRVVAGPFESQQAEAMRRNVSDKAWLLPI